MHVARADAVFLCREFEGNVREERNLCKAIALRLNDRCNQPVVTRCCNHLVVSAAALFANAAFMHESGKVLVMGYGYGIDQSL